MDFNGTTIHIGRVDPPPDPHQFPWYARIGFKRGTWTALGNTPIEAVNALLLDLYVQVKRLEEWKAITADQRRALIASDLAPAGVCCERDYDADGNCDRHPAAPANPCYQ